MMDIPQTLKSALLDRFVVPFVGAGVSRAVTTKAGHALFPNWAELLQSSVTRLRNDGKTHEADVVQGLINKRHPDYLAAAKYACEGLGPVWYVHLRERFAPPESSADPGSLALAKAIWKLPSNLVVTTNYDHVLAWTSPAPNDVARLSVDATVELAAMLRNGVERPTVWHLHGNIDDAKSLILTPDGYSTLYPDTDGRPVRYEAALQSLRHLLAARTFLFIGFSLDDEQFGGQLEWVNATFGDATGPHFLLVRECDRRETQRRLRPLTNVEYLSFEDFGGPLVEYIEQLASARSAPHHVDVESPRPEPAATRVAAVPAVATPDPLVELRASYRRVYNFHRTTFQRLTELSDELARLGLDFERWDPTYYARPARSTTEFFRHPYWTWDFLPAYALTLSWQSSSGKTPGGARRLVVQLDTDSDFAVNLPGEPITDRFSPPEATTSDLSLYLFKSNDPSATLSEAWRQLSDPTLVDGADHTVTLSTGTCTVRVISVPLEAILASADFEAKVLAPLREWYSRT